MFYFQLTSLSFLEPRELSKHILGAIRYYKRMEPARLKLNYGVILKRSGSNPHLTVKTFAGYIHEIPGKFMKMD